MRGMAGLTPTTVAVSSDGHILVDVSGGSAAGVQFDDGDAIDTTSQGNLILGTDGVPGTARALRCSAGGTLLVDGSAVTQPVSSTNLDIRDLTSVSDSVAAAQSGSWTVAATQSGGWTVTANQGGAWTVAATQSGAWTVAATQSGAWSVSVTGSVTVTATDLDIRNLASGQDSVAAVQSGSWSVTADTELPAAAALADDAANPTTPTVGAAGLVFDGSAWDRLRLKTADYDTGVGTDTQHMFGMAIAAAGGQVPVSIANPVPVSDAGGSLTVDGTVTADTELPAAAALADDMANPTTPLVGACLMGFDGTTWDRINVKTGDFIDGPGTETRTIFGIGFADSSGQVPVSTAFPLPVDTEFGSTATSSDGLGNATTCPVLGYGYLFNGTSWDRWRGDTSGAQIQGVAATDAAVAGKPVYIGGRANDNEPAAVSADADMVPAWMDRLGRMVVCNDHPTPLLKSFEMANNTNDQEVIATPGANLSLYVTSMMFDNQSTTATHIEMKEGAAGTVKWSLFAVVNGGSGHTFKGWWKLPADTALNAALTGGVAGSRINVEYFIAA